MLSSFSRNKHFVFIDVVNRVVERMKTHYSRVIFFLR